MKSPFGFAVFDSPCFFAYNSREPPDCRKITFDSPRFVSPCGFRSENCLAWHSGHSSIHASSVCKLSLCSGLRIAQVSGRKMSRASSSNTRKVAKRIVHATCALIAKCADSPSIFDSPGRRTCLISIVSTQQLRFLKRGVSFGAKISIVRLMSSRRPRRIRA